MVNHDDDDDENRRFRIEVLQNCVTPECISDFQAFGGTRVALKMIHQNSLKHVNFPDCNLLSPVSEPSDSFKYAEIKQKIRRNVKNRHSKVMR